MARGFRKKWPERDAQRIREIVDCGAGQADLWEASPIRIEDRISADELVTNLFPEECLLCCGCAVNKMITRPAVEWKGTLGNCQFIVPSPMSARSGKTKNGKPSARCLENVGLRRFLVAEFDHGTFDDQAAIILRLATKMPLTIVCKSGGKSLHAWFYCAGLPEPRLQIYMRWAVAVGADPATWNRCQPVRMPEGIRDNGERQKVLFLNLSAMK